MALSMDCGTYNLITARRTDDGNIAYKREVNAFIEMPIENRFVFNMMKNAGVPLIEREEVGVAYALGEAAVEIAYTMNQVNLKRPMKDGCLNPKEKYAQQIMSIMMHSLLGELTCDNETLYYSVPANAINEETDAEYHSKILEAVFKAFKDKNGKIVSAHPINEGLALIYAELHEKQWTGIGVSLGAGMVNLCFAKFGAPIFDFSIVNSGDWIDKMAAKATGETSAYINKEKEKVDLSKDQDSLVGRAIQMQYQIMIQKTVKQIKLGLEKTENDARGDKPIDIIIAGGTSSPVGFDDMFKKAVEGAKLPIDIGDIIRPENPLYSVSKGCLIAAENAN